MTSTGEVWRLGRLPVLHLAAPLAAASTAFAGMALYWGWTHPDRDIAQTAGDYLLGGGLDVYAVMPEAQMGPLALILTGALPLSVYAVLFCALAGVFTHLAVTGLRITGWHVVGAALMGYPWHRYALTGHADDALVLLGAAGIILSQRRAAAWWVPAAWFLFAVAAKPTAVMFLPLVFLMSRRAGLVAIAGTVVIWLPFASADPVGLLAAGGGVVEITPQSLLGLLGASGDYPGWVRPLQVLGAWAACWLLGCRGLFAAAVVVAVAWRALLEPGAYPLYSASLMSAALVFDVRTWGYPLLTLLATWSWLLSSFPPLTASEAVGRLLVITGVVALAAAALRRDRGKGSGSPPGGGDPVLYSEGDEVPAYRIVAAGCRRGYAIEPLNPVTARSESAVTAGGVVGEGPPRATGC